MSAKQPQHAPVRLVIADFSENAAYEYDSLLRDAGIATRLKIVELPMAREALKDADMMLCNAALPQAEQLVPAMAAQYPNIPIILISNAAAPLTATDGMRLGAVDVVPQDEREQLMFVFKRELEHVCQYHRLHQIRRSLKEAEERCLLLLQSSQAAISYVHEGMHIYANEGYLRQFGFADADALLGLPLIDLLDPDSTDRLKAELKAFRQDESERTLRINCRSTIGAAFKADMTLAAADYEGERCIQVTIRVDQAPDTRANSSAVNSAGEAGNHQENGTGVAHAVYANGSAATLQAFQRSISSELGAADGQFFGVFIAQLNAFTRLQTAHGLAGAATIANAAQTALKQAHGTGIFIALAPDSCAFAMTARTRDEALEHAQNCRKAVEALTLEIDEKTVRPTVSIAGAEIEGHEREDVESASDRALDSAFVTVQRMLQKEEFNAVALPSLSGEEGSLSAETGRILTLINEAIESQKFVLLFQPIISLRGDSDEHYEVFLRMLDRNDERMLPDQFLRTAIENGAAGKIDRWVILQSIKLLSAHRARGHNTRLTINLTCNSVTDPEFIHWLGVAVKAARLPSDAIIFQLTEQDAATYLRQTREFLEGLKSIHCRSALSRFGLTAEPFEILRQMPVEFVKLDGSHIERMMADQDYRGEVTQTIKQLQAAGKLTIVPMVENANALSALWQAGANYIQGHYLQEPSTTMDYDFSTDD